MRFRHFRGCHLLILAATFLLPPGALSWAAGEGFTPQKRAGLAAGDQWEPAIAADGYGHVYLLYPQYGMMPGCAACSLPAMILAVSKDNGATWGRPRQIAPAITGQFDAQIVVDPVDRKTVYASWVQNHKNDTVLAKSVDFGQTWSVVVANRTKTDVDKPVMSVRGLDVYLGFSHGSRVWVASSHDGGNSFSAVNVNPEAKPGWSSAGGAAVDPAGNVYISWSAYNRKAGVRTPVELYLSKSLDGGVTWATTLLDVSEAPPDCTAYYCSSGYLGAQITMAADAAGTVYALWNAGNAHNAPERIYFSSSTTAGATWSPRADISSAPQGVEHGFPTIVAGSAGDVRVAWMDTRNPPLWNVYYRSSTNGGATWSAESRLSGYVPGYDYVQREGFRFPFGDYFGMDIGSRGETHVVWGEGMNFETPGSIWYSSGR